MSFDDFEDLLLDKPDNERWELIRGRVVRGMVGARWEHGLIAQNIAFALRSHFKATGRTCHAFQETFFVESKALDFAVMPDVVVGCGPLEPGATSVDDPTVVVEVLSPGTESRDRYEKWDCYKDLPSLRHYVLITRDKPLIEIRTRTSAGLRGETIEGLDRTFALAALEFEMPVAAVYEDVTRGL